MEAIYRLIPIALAVAISSIPITIAIFILLSPHRTRSAVAFLAGWVAGIALLVTACALFVHGVAAPQFGAGSDTVVGVVEIVVGFALIVLAAVTWWRSRAHTAAASAPKWVTASKRLGPWSSLGVGFLLNFRPKGILLAIAAGVTVHADAATLPVAVVAVVVYTVVGASTVAAPIVAMLTVPSVVEPRLVRINAWMVRHGGALARVILAVVGVAIVGMGIARL